jgi:hypothetical protein
MSCSSLQLSPFRRITTAGFCRNLWNESFHGRRIFPCARIRHRTGCVEEYLFAACLGRQGQVAETGGADQDVEYFFRQ